MSKTVWAILIMFFIFIFGLPLMSYVSITSGSLHGGDPEATLEILEEIEENVNVCCAVTMEPDEVLELIDKLKKFLNEKITK